MVDILGGGTKLLDEVTGRRRSKRIEIPLSEKRLLTEYEVEALYGLGVKYLRNCRQGLCSTPGPPFLKISRKKIRYDRIEVEKWLAAQQHGGEQIKAPAPPPKKSTPPPRRASAAA
jgi:hypothetical protein